ncbi:CDP-diacylglycerol--inositol 3-phosphatidyltransferase 1-like [Citrus clementina]|uniref:CDP-diacylglycerol--inositol 3-phosphatidyltransferase 1-like n=1 Tax=Citrus clementina TaxID=85681 RepID=UPI000CECF2E4|nr:CDP-diacylglycerol--inositol 3-phosphatidyltransferase 1-like [Citrus x clementina]
MGTGYLWVIVVWHLLYLILFLIAGKQNESLVDIVVSAVQQGSPLSFLVALSLFGWATKQMINVIQMKTAADVCALYDIEKKQKP